MGQVSKMNQQYRQVQARRPKSDGHTIKAGDVEPGMYIFLDNLKRAKPSFREVFKVESLDGNRVRIHTLALTSGDLIPSDFPTSYEVSVLIDVTGFDAPLPSLSS